MPTYEYACEACGHAWEATQSIKDEPLKKCPACKKLKAKRQISAGTGFILKGGGWYSDLYASSSGKKGGEAADKSDATSKSSEKPAASSESPSAAPPADQGKGKKKGAKGGSKAD